MVRRALSTDSFRSMLQNMVSNVAIRFCMPNRPVYFTYQQKQTGLKRRVGPKNIARFQTSSEVCHMFYHDFGIDTIYLQP